MPCAFRLDDWQKSLQKRGFVYDTNGNLPSDSGERQRIIIFAEDWKQRSRKTHVRVSLVMEFYANPGFWSLSCHLPLTRLLVRHVRQKDLEGSR